MSTPFQHASGAAFAAAEFVRASAAQADAELVKRLRARDEKAFSQLVERLHGSLVRMAMTFVKSKDVAEETVQDTWIAVIDGLAGFENRSSLKTWIFRILVNRAITRGTREGRSVPFSSLGPAEKEDGVELERFTGGFWSDPPKDWDRPQEKRLVEKETQAFLEIALEQLPPNQKAVVVLRDVEGCSSEEVCNVLEISEPNQRVLLHRGRTRLRAALDRHFASARGKT